MPNEAYRPITPYDYPLVLATQAIDQETTLRGLHPSLMTPHERDSIADRLRERAGGGDFVDALIGAATNPWVWLFVVTSKTGMNLLPRPAAGKIFASSLRDSAFVREGSTIFEALRTLTPAQVLRGTPLEAVMQQAMDSIRKSELASQSRIAPHYRKIVEEANGIKTTLSDATNPLAKEINTLLYIKLAGLDKAHEVKFWAKKLRTKTVEPLVDAAIVDRRVQELGLQPLIDAYRADMDTNLITLFGKEGLPAGAFEADPNKLLRVWKSLQRSVVSQHMDDAADMLSGILDESVLSAVRAGRINKEEFAGLVKSRFESVIDRTYYVPRNNYTVRDTQFRLVDNGAYANALRAKGLPVAQGATKASLARAKAVPLYDTEDLEYLKRFASDTTVLDKEIRRSMHAHQTRASKGEYTKLLKLDFEASYDRYVMDSARTKALFVDPIGERVLEYQKTYNDFARKTIEAGKHRSFSGLDQVEALDDQKTILDVLDGGGPDGHGYTLADALYSGFRLLNDKHAVHSMSELYVPYMLGRLPIRDAFTHAVLRKAKVAGDAMLDAVKPHLAGKSPEVDALLGRMQEAVDSPVTAGRARGWSSDAAGYLYGSHMGFNIGSIITNTMQPFISTGRFLPTAAIAEGYATVLKQMAGYIGDRLKSGKVFLPDEDKLALMIKHFGADMVQATGIGPGSLELIDNVAFTRQLTRGRGSTLDRITDLSLKGFEKGEWLNRLVTANAGKMYHQKSGMPVGEAGMWDEIRTLVNETQFGGQFMNTPELFLDPRGPLNNPLVRQFMSFPLRMVTSVGHVGPRVGDQGYALNMARDLVRGMGLSALMYEGFKGTLGWNIDNSLFFATTTQPFTQPRMPPILDIPKNLVAGVYEGDREKLRKELPRLVPGGIAISRALGVSPSLQGTPLGFVQKTYVDWNQRTPEGMVGVMDKNGALISYENPASLVMRHLGVPDAELQDQQALEGYMLRQREQIIDYRRRYLRALMANDVSKALTIAAEFEKRYKFKLPVEKKQVKDYIEMRTTPRVERILDRVPTEARPYYTGLVGQAMGNRLGVPPEQFNAFQTSKERNPARVVGYQPPPIVQQVLAGERSLPGATPAFQGFDPTFRADPSLPL